MFVKRGYYADGGTLRAMDKESALVDPVVAERFEKFAQKIRDIAPKSDDFLYFTIIFMKAAEASLIDEKGEPKKVGSETAWGYFDKNYKWHGNVKAHKNNNCFIAGTRITMHDGSVKNIEDVMAGDLVITHTGLTRKVSQTFIADYSGPVLTIKSQNNSSITCTPEHPLYCPDISPFRLKGLTGLNLQKKKDDNYRTMYRWVSADLIDVGELLSSPIPKKIIKSSLTVGQARVLGIFAAEGCYSKKYNRRQGLKFTLGITEEKQAQKIKELINIEFPGCSVNINHKPEISVIEVTATGNDIQSFFYHHVGEYCDQKKLSQEVVFSTDENKKSFLVGWLDGDGCLTRYNKLIGQTSSPDMANQIHLMMESLGIAASLRKKKPFKEKIIIKPNYPAYPCKDHFRMEIGGSGYKKLGIDKNTVKYVFEEDVPHTDIGYFDGNYSLHYVKDIKKENFSGKVYNFEVEDDHSYIANGIAVHNCDIFPESELKKHAKDWIGQPLCVDHQSSSVDGVRGIILDTHYDEKLKQVVGLCALDRINYPDLARKVETGVIRYGSMGTGVETSICFDCGNKAATQKDYCKCSRYGEINIGLKPIEYSLVVQPAEPGATLLRCIASLKTYQDEFINYGVDNVDEMLGKLSESQAQHLEQIMKTACGKDGCSIPQRRKIVTSFLKENDIIKNAAQEVDKFSIALKSIQEATGDTVKDALAQGKTSASFSAYKAIYDAYGIPMSSQPQGETLSSYENAQGGGSLDLKDNGDVRDTGTASSPMVGGVVPDHPTNPFGGDGDTKGVGPESYAYAAKSMNNKIREASDFYFRSIMEDYMNEDQLRRRAEARRKVAYHQGGAAPAVEPKTYKDQGKDQVKIRNTEDKQMKQDFGPHDAATGVLKEDKSVKEQLKRAELDDKRQRRIAYLQGGAAPAAEPKTYKDQGKEQVKIRNTEDKQMKQDFGPHDPATGVLKEDKSVKEQQKRAAYEGPALKTRFSKVRDLNGGIDKKASTFEVFSGDEKVISATAGDIFGDHLDQEMAEDPETTHWDWVSSQEYGKAVVATIREKGVGHVKGLLAKKAQALPDVMAPEMPAEPAVAPEVMPEEAPMEMGGDIESALMKAEEAIEEIRELTATEVPGTEGEGVELEPEKLALSRMVFKQLKSAQQDLSAAADELAMAAATCDVAGTLPAEQRSALSGIVTEAISDAAELRGEATALIGIAKVMLRSMVKTAEYVEVAPVTPTAAVTPVATPTEDDSLMLETLAFRKDRRARWASELLKKQAMESLEEDEASDACGEGMPVVMLEMEGEEHEHEEKKEDDAEDCADCADAAQSAASDGAVAPVASPAATVAVNSAADMAPKVEEKKEELKEDKASDPAEAMADATVKAKLSDTFMAKKAGEEREAYRYKLRRAYDVALDMQRKGLVPGTKPALDRQVDEIIQFDDKAFEAFKRAIDNTQAVQSIKIATDLGGLNVGVGIEERTVEMPKIASGIKDLAKLWDR